MDALPARTVHVREIGDRSHRYEQASSSDGLRLDLDPGEMEPIAGGRCSLSSSGAERWSLPDGTLALVTNRRLAWLTTSFDTGGGWAGVRALGVVVATTANAVSRRQAARRAAGRVAIGHVRHEWVAAVQLRRRKALIGVVDSYLDIEVVTAAGRVSVELWGKGLIDERFARWFAQVVAHERLVLADALLPQGDRTELREIAAGAPGVAWGSGSTTGLRWTMPGDACVLVEAARGRDRDSGAG
ncbi:hypothetical protein [Microlunatus flavus]|uniref:Uncharacterized protein n=1 Tax=Microlunatus flavus TaxID=1036181 RepID=A0A1H9AIG7_9ACTN|nr:hypothetical protein [Microlunatus flavus]SEP76287.1 hypothetical protein SAMN05421756_101615 [Microlunatus flavus]